MMKITVYSLLAAALLIGCAGNAQVQLGADRLDQLLPATQGKRVALLVNQTSRLTSGEHLLDALLGKGVDVRKIFAPEHGFRGDADAGAGIKDGNDTRTGLPIVSLYGNNKKPTPAQLADIDVLLYDIQDVGTRFYTYISAMHYAMEACAENGKQFIVLDRPNPNDHVAGPVLQMQHSSYVGMHPIPVQYGLTCGELAMMINGEGWLSKAIHCDLQVITLLGWKHGQPYDLPVKPSPNLPNRHAILLYPSLCLFEATVISVGRGTVFPFEAVGYPDKKMGSFHFRPASLKGFESNPLYRDRDCYGFDLRQTSTDGAFTLAYLLLLYKKWGKSDGFFKNAQFFARLSGNSDLKGQIESGMSAQDIEKTWQPELDAYKQIREKYLLYSEDVSN